MIKCFERSTVERIEENQGELCPAVYLYAHSSALLNIALEKEGEKKKKSYYNTGYSYLVTHPSTVSAE